MNDRRSLLKSLLAAPFAFLYKPKVRQPLPGEMGNCSTFQWAEEVNVGKAKVEVLEHNTGESRYVTRWEFDAEAEAIAFVRSLMPKLTKVWVPERWKASCDITRMEVVIVSKDAPDDILIAGWLVDDLAGDERERLPFWSISNAWTYLTSIRVNGKVVSRTTRPGGSLSQYFVEPFLKGTPEIIYPPSYLLKQKESLQEAWAELGRPQLL